MRRRRIGFTLTELMIVIVILGILAGLAIPNYLASRERSFDKEAVAGLNLIRSAEKAVNAYREAYWPPAGSNGVIAQIDGNLSLGLTENNWDYTILRTGTGFCATAVRPSRTWTITEAAGDPTCSGTCY